MTLDAIVNIPGNLQTAYTASVAGKNKHVDELMNERRTNPITPEGDDLRIEWFYTPDGNIYSLQKGIPTLDITREKDNLVLRHLNDSVNSSFDQLIHNHNYKADPGEAKTAMEAPETVRINLTQLRLKRENNEWGYLTVSTTHYDQLNEEERKLAERVFGQGTDFVANMKMLKDATIKETRIYVLVPEYVTQHAGAGPLGRASRLRDFSNYSSFDADDRVVVNHYALRGVRRVVAAGDAPHNALVPSAPQEMTPTRCYDALLADPAGAVKALDDQKAAGLTRIVADYLATKAQ